MRRRRFTSPLTAAMALMASTPKLQARLEYASSNARAGSSPLLAYKFPSPSSPSPLAVAASRARLCPSNSPAPVPNRRCGRIRELRMVPPRPSPESIVLRLGAAPDVKNLSIAAASSNVPTIDIHLDSGRYTLDAERPAALVGDSLYYLCWPGILRYRYGLLRPSGMIPAGIREDDVLSMMEMPSGERLGIGKFADVVLMAAEGGGLGLACLCHKTRTNLYLLARETEGTVLGDEQWVQRRVIDLKKLLPVSNPKMKPCLTGLAQDANVIFVSTKDGVFSVDHGGSSLQARKVCEKGVVNHWMYPFVSFYTESLLMKS